MTVLGGNTIKITTTFEDEGVAIDPEVVKFILYDDTYKKLSEVVLDSDNRVNT